MSTEHGLLTDDRKRVYRNIIGWLLEGRVITLPPVTPPSDGPVVRWREALETWEQDGDLFEAREPGVFMQMTGTRGGETFHRWGRYCGLDDIPAVLDGARAKLSPRDYEAWYVGVVASIGLRDINRGDRRDGVAVPGEDGSREDGVPARRMR